MTNDSDPSRFYWERVARPASALPPAAPACVSAKRWNQLGRFVERAFTHRGDWRPGLRLTIRHIVREMRLQGASDAEVRDALRRAVLDHPACGQHDRELLTTGQRYSVQLLAVVQSCIDPLDASGPRS